MKLYYVDYFDVSTLPRHMFPLPIPSEPRGTISKRLDRLLTRAEQFLKLPKEQVLKTRVPTGLFTYKTENKVMHLLLISICSDIEFFLRWTDVEGGEDDKPEYFPKGIRVLIDNSRDDLERELSFARSCDYREFVVREYEEAYDRCASLCDATRRGHLAEKGTRLEFSVEHVQTAMKEHDHFVGILDYGHIRKALLKEAAP